VLSPDEIHKLTSKMGADEGKASCHSDYVPDAEDAKRLQSSAE
jgi:hypothetical protein